jgi:adenosylcobinamide-GDP ribazoletransferase
MKEEIKIFLTAVMYFTRIPCPQWVGHSDERLTKCVRYFPFIGILVGVVGATVYYGGALLFPHPLAVLLSMVSTILLTGAFHEDGLADMCDGFGGGWTKQSIMEIMKDSRIGTFGVIALVSVFALKFASLCYTNPARIPLVLIAGHALSRLSTTAMMFTLVYVQDEDRSRAKPAAKRTSAVSLVVAAVFGIAPLCFFSGWTIFLTLIPVFAAQVWLSRFYFKWIGGQTGDCCGATQQICETTFYLSALAIWKYT